MHVIIVNELVTRIIATAFGMLGAAIAIGSYQFKNVRTLMLLQIISSFLFAVQFFFLGAWAGLACNVIGALMRVTVYIKSKKRPAMSDKPAGQVLASPGFWVFVVMFVLIAVFTYDKPWSVLPSVAMIPLTYSIWNADAKMIRRLNFFVVCPLWLLYNIITGAYAGIITELFNMTSIVIAFLRFREKSVQSVHK